jgi:predicted GIY-YIG superfamily endonuclease
MNPKFRRAVDSLHGKFRALAKCPPRERGAALPKKGVYLFCERGKALYIGRSDNIRRRFYDHRRPSSDTNKAGFAMLMVRKQLGLKAAYRSGPNARAGLAKNPTFIAAFRKAKERICKMQFRAVEESDPTRQALLEIYCAVALSARFNDFKNH